MIAPEPIEGQAPDSALLRLVNGECPYGSGVGVVSEENLPRDWLSGRFAIERAIIAEQKAVNLNPPPAGRMVRGLRLELTVNSVFRQLWQKVS
jgi:hypothetical protein